MTTAAYSAFAFEGRLEQLGPYAPLVQVPGVDIVLTQTLHDRSSSLETLDYQYFIEVEGNFNNHVRSDTTDSLKNGAQKYGLLAHSYSDTDGLNYGRMLPVGSIPVRGGTVMAQTSDDVTKGWHINVVLTHEANGILKVDSVVAVESDADEVLGANAPDKVHSWTDNLGGALETWTDDHPQDLTDGLPNHILDAHRDGDEHTHTDSAHLLGKQEFSPQPLTTAVLNEGLQGLAAHKANIEGLYHNKDIVDKWTITFDDVLHGDDNAVAMYAFRNFKTGKNVFNLHDKIVAKTSFSYVVKVTDAESQEHTFFQGQSPDVFGVVKQTYPGSNVDRLVSFGDSNADIGNTAATIPVDDPQPRVSLQWCIL